MAFDYERSYSIGNTQITSQAGSSRKGFQLDGIETITTCLGQLPIWD